MPEPKTYIVPRVRVVETFMGGQPQGKFDFTLLEADLGDDFKSGSYKLTLEKIPRREDE